MDTTNKIPIKDTKYTVHHKDSLSQVIDPKKVEKGYNVKYIGEFTLKDTKGWFNGPVQVYYGEKHPVGSSYMGLYLKGVDQKPYVVDAISAVKDVDTGAPVVYIGIERDDKVLYSAFRHDYQSLGSAHFIDGGRDYVKSSLSDNSVRFFIQEDKLVHFTKDTEEDNPTIH